jgi:hypothetical protein
MLDTPSDLIPFQQAAAFLPGRPHIATLHRWRLHGVRGRKLPTVLVGGRRFVSRQVLAAWLQADSVEVTPPPIGLSGGSQLRSEAARKALRAFGVRSPQSESP